MAYSNKVMDHYNNPRNVGSFAKSEENVGTGIVGAPECGDVMKLQIKVIFAHQCTECQHAWAAPSQESTCPNCSGIKLNVEQLIVDAKFKTFGCGSAIASSSLVTEWVKGKTLEEASKIKNAEVASYLSLPPVKIHCSVLAESTIKAAVEDWKKKQQAALDPKPEKGN